MTRITKQLASEITAKLLEKKNEKLSKIRNERNIFINDMAKNACPNDVLKISEKYPEYFNTGQPIYLNSQYIGYGYNYPMKRNESLYIKDSNLNDEFHKIENRIKDYESKLKKLKSDLQETIFNLRTYKKVKENFPQAAKYLPEETETGIALNIPDLIQSLENL